MGYTLGPKCNVGVLMGTTHSSILGQNSPQDWWNVIIQLIKWHGTTVDLVMKII